MKKVFMLVMVIVMLTSVFVGCSTETKVTQTQEGKQTVGEEEESGKVDNEEVKKEGLKEAPMLAERVTAGDLPSVEERMPVKEDIMIQEVVEEIGQYGGEWRNLWTGIDNKWAVENVTEEPLFRFNGDGSGVEPNVAKGYDVNDNSTEYLIYLREGMKWSDGMPFTADDVIFYYEHMLKPETFGKPLYGCYYSTNPETGERTACEMEKVDDYTVKVTFDFPNPLFLERVAIDNKWMFAPAHFYKTILPEFIGEEAALAKAKEWGFEDLKSFGKWTGYYYWVWPERPSLRCWVPANDPHGDPFILERNPYYFKTDKEGNQLPYIDKLVYNVVQDLATSRTMEFLGGSIPLAPVADIALFKENEEKGDFRISKLSYPQMGSKGIELNQSVKDPKKREIFQDIRFREALSVAADRQEIVDICTGGLAELKQASIPKGLPQYQEGWEDKWIEYDPDRANQLLDEIGLKWDDNHKWRTFPDGSKFDLTIHFIDKWDSTLDEFVALIKKYYETVGIQTNVKLVDDTFYRELKSSNDIECAAAIEGVMNIAFRPDSVVPTREAGLTPWYGDYGTWYMTNGEKGMKPEGDIAKVIELWNKANTATTKEEVMKYCNEIAQLHAKNIWIIGYGSQVPAFEAYSNKLRNIPETYVMCDEFRNIMHAKPSQFFFRQD